MCPMTDQLGAHSHNSWAKNRSKKRPQSCQFNFTARPQKKAVRFYFDGTFLGETESIKSASTVLYGPEHCDDQKLKRLVQTLRRLHAGSETDALVLNGSHIGLSNMLNLVVASTEGDGEGEGDAIDSNMSKSRVVSTKIFNGASASTCAPAFDSASGSGFSSGFDSGFVRATNDQDLRAILTQLDIFRIPEQTVNNQGKRRRTEGDPNGNVGGGDGVGDVDLLGDNAYKFA